MYDRDTLLNDLRRNVIEVTFTKVDGTERIMRCTLDPKYMPPKMEPENVQEAHKHNKVNTDVIAVWDIQQNGWRSFRVDSVNYVQMVETI
jgi:hypothetical protein